MSYDTITVTPSSPHIGAEIGNIDLTRPLSNRQVQEVHDAVIAHGVIFFRNQKIDFGSHERLVCYFGEPHVHVGGEGTASKAVPGHPAIRKQYFDASSKRVSGEEWHSDQSCAEIPPMYSVLYQEKVPPNGGGDTMFSSAYKAYEELSADMKAYLGGKTATHDGGRAFDKKQNTYPIWVPQSSFATRKVGASCSSSIASLPATLTRCRRRKAAACWRFCTSTWRAHIGACDSAGLTIRSHSGTTAAPSITRSGIIGRTCARDTACSLKALNGRSRRERNQRIWRPAGFRQ